MANWAFTEYVIEGPKEILLRIENAILHPIQPEGADENWEGGVLKALGLTWEERKPDGTGKYMRGFINEELTGRCCCHRNRPFRPCRLCGSFRSRP